MSSKLHQLVLSLFIQSWHPLANYAVKTGVVCLQVKLCDPHLSTLEVRFLRRGAIQIYVYVYTEHKFDDCSFITRTNTQTDADECFTPATLIGTSNNNLLIHNNNNNNKFLQM